MDKKTEAATVFWLVEGLPRLLVNLGFRACWFYSGVEQSVELVQKGEGRVVITGTFIRHDLMTIGKIHRPTPVMLSMQAECRGSGTRSYRWVPCTYHIVCLPRNLQVSL